MRNNWRVRTPVELAPGRTVYVEDMTSLEFEKFAEALEHVKGEGAAGLGDAYAALVHTKAFLSEDGAEAAFGSAPEAREALSFKQLDAIVKVSTAQSLQSELGARFQDGGGEDEGVETVPDGPDVRVPAARTGNGDGH